MAWTTPRTWVTNEVLSKALLDEQVRDNLAYLKLNIALEEAGELTISSGAVTKSRSHHTIDTEGDAASDDLASILGGSEGEVILIRPANGARTVVLKHNTGNIWSMSGYDVTLDDADDYSILVYSGSKWTILGGSGAGTVNTSGVPEANDIARFTDLDTIEGLSYAEFLAAIGVEAGATKYPDTGEQAFLDADHSKLDGIESLADVTDATNVAAAGAVMEGDTTTVAMSFVIDEDDLASNLDTKVPTQQSVKAYVDANIGGGGGVGVTADVIGFRALLLPDGYLPYFDIDDGIVRVLPSPTQKWAGFPLLQGFSMKNGLVAVY